MSSSWSVRTCSAQRRRKEVHWPPRCYSKAQYRRGLVLERAQGGPVHQLHPATSPPPTPLISIPSAPPSSRSTTYSTRPDDGQEGSGRRRGDCARRRGRRRQQWRRQRGCGADAVGFDHDSMDTGVLPRVNKTTSSTAVRIGRIRKNNDRKKMN